MSVHTCALPGTPLEEDQGVWCTCMECGQAWEARDGRWWKHTTIPTAPHTSWMKPFNTKRRRHRTKTKRKGTMK